MNRSDLDRILAAALSERRLLAHPFYRRWEAGAVTMAELAAYAAQYRHFESALPEMLSLLHDGLAEGPARDLVAANLADERGDPVPHLQLFDRFARAVGATSEPPTPATAGLLGTYGELVAGGPAVGLAGFAAYETQAAEVARTKATGLRRHYGLDAGSASFWSRHADVDRRHDEWLRDALTSVAHEPGETASAVGRAADAWWAFLDEREAAAPSA